MQITIDYDVLKSGKRYFITNPEWTESDPMSHFWLEVIIEKTSTPPLDE